MCYLVSRHLTDTRMLCMSSVTENDLHTQLRSKEAGELLDHLKENEQFLMLTEESFLKVGVANPAADSSKNDWRQADALVLPIMLYDKEGRPRDEQIYLICQRRGKPLWCQNKMQAILQIRDTLFLRGKLAQALSRDLTSLLTEAREFRSIRRKSQEPDPLNILHISDLHVTGENYEQLKKNIQRLKLEKGPFDFLVITGDVVQGRYAAGDLEQNYDCAAEVIRTLAMRMWGEEQDGKNILHQDWKRRTIVIPGNHDYASMNELETQHGENHRISESGKPATQEGSAMAKFTYYINFVRKLLDIEIGDLIDNNLNELRCYDKMGVAFLCVNTSIMANPARNNKVHLDEDFVRRAIQRLSSETEKLPVIFLGHHGPSYEIDYVADEYLEPFICHSLIRAFVEAVQKDTDEDRKSALKLLDDNMKRLKPRPGGEDIVADDFVQAWLQRNKPKELPPDIENRVIKRRMNTRLYRQITFLKELLNKDPMERSVNERYQKIIAEIGRARLLSKNDQEAYKVVFGLLDKLEPAACLSGHTHVWQLDEDKRYFVAKRFDWVRTDRKDANGNELKQSHSLNYGVCKVSRKSPHSNVNVVYNKVEELLK